MHYMFDGDGELVEIKSIDKTGDEMYTTFDGNGCEISIGDNTFLIEIQHIDLLHQIIKKLEEDELMKYDKEETR